ncbi:MAG: lytic transglycosylase domain-containing protein [Candidatus Azobacteroides sp.]|nr:lytic transglycosylase domain-containing protein [Candidatus Azobacteroides sp.]
MKKIYKYIIPTFTLVGLLTGALLWTASSNSAQEAEQQRSGMLSLTNSPEVPLKLQFADQEFDMSRYDMYERLDRELTSFTYLHSTTLLYFKRANRIFPIVVPILKQNGIPEDFKYLMTIESGLNERAISSAKAAGLWQFMQTTGKQYGLEISTEVDERYHIEKATVAACKYLKDAYARYGDWASVAASYNGGMGRISSELNKQNVSTALDLLLVEETSRYFFRILAIKEIFENPYRYGFVIKPHQLYKPIEWKEVTVSSSVNSWTNFAQKNGITYAQLKDFNVWLRDTSLLNKSGKSYKIRIPLKEDMYYKQGEKAKVYDPRWVN